MIDRDFFMATMGFLANVVNDIDLECPDDNIFGLCGALISVFAWVFRAPENIFYSYIGFQNSDYDNYFDFVMDGVLAGDVADSYIALFFPTPESMKGLRTTGELYDYLVGETKKTKLN